MRVLLNNADILKWVNFDLHLQFEWAWQHPMESLAVRRAAATFKSFSGVANKIKLAYTMLNLPNWERYALVNLVLFNQWSVRQICNVRLLSSA